MIIEFDMDLAQGRGGVLSPILVRDFPRSPSGRVEIVCDEAILVMEPIGKYALRMEFERQPECDDTRAFLSEAIGFRGAASSVENGCVYITIPLEGFRSSLRGSMLRCRANVGEGPVSYAPSPLEIPGVRTVLVLCDRIERFQDFFRIRHPDGVRSAMVFEFGETVYAFATRHCSYGLMPENTRFATLGSLVDGIGNRDSEMAYIFDELAVRFNRIWIDSGDEEISWPGRSRRMTATEETILRYGYRLPIEGRPVARGILDAIQGIVQPSPIALEAMRGFMGPRETVGDDTGIENRMPMSYQDFDQVVVSGALEMRGMRASVHWVRAEQSGIGDLACLNNARDRNLRCAVNPCGPCDGCKHFEKRDD